MTEPMTKKEAAARARCSERTIGRAIKSGDLVAGGTKGLVRIEEEDYLDWFHRKNNKAHHDDGGSDDGTV